MLGFEKILAQISIWIVGSLLLLFGFALLGYWLLTGPPNLREDRMLEIAQMYPVGHSSMGLLTESQKPVKFVFDSPFKYFEGDEESGSIHLSDKSVGFSYPFSCIFELSKRSVSNIQCSR